MFRNIDSDTVVSPASPADNAIPKREPIRHLLFGSSSGIQRTIQTLHRLGYAEPNDWSALLPTGRPGEMMTVLTKHLRNG